MGCPRGARTKPRSKIQPSQRRRRFAGRRRRPPTCNVQPPREAAAVVLRNQCATRRMLIAPPRAREAASGRPSSAQTCANHRPPSATIARAAKITARQERRLAARGLPIQSRNQCAGQCTSFGQPLCSSCLTRSAQTDSPRKTDRSKSDQFAAAVEAGGGGGFWERREAAESFRDTASRGPTTIVAPESQFRTCPSDHNSIGYPRMSASGESSTTMHRLLHASGPHPIPPPNDPKTNQYNQDLGLIHSTNGNHLESPNEGSSIDHQESTKSWADTDSESSSSSSSSSDSEQEEVHCIMADQTSDDEVFDFSNVEFTREDLVSALNEMVKEYRKLSHSFEEVKAENSDLKNSSAEPSAFELGEADSLKIELSKLTPENELLREESSELKAEIERLNELVSSWNQSSRSLHKLQESQKPANDRTGLGFNSSENSEGETSTLSQPVYDKCNKMSFVKANVIYDCWLRQWWPKQGERTRRPAGGHAACSMAGASTCSDNFSLVRSRFEARSVMLEPPRPEGGPSGRAPAGVAGAGRTNEKTRD
ncbi:hypothetical protein F511_30689 [Dorcoceras hygrometricum]|uniref:Uncharacterized protein n=1 Tax=Dorcoceras hygrometricum TaxID=472368 RepID=A0A2Z7C1I1_9LAMI|nr:hypothetical protein F511_30689 [Dorcoceras hygrometricum]